MCAICTKNNHEEKKYLKGFFVEGLNMFKRIFALAISSKIQLLKWIMIKTTCVLFERPFKNIRLYVIWTTII